jgi:hypothetical protein
MKTARFGFSRGTGVFCRSTILDSRSNGGFAGFSAPLEAQAIERCNVTFNANNSCA